MLAAVPKKKISPPHIFWSWVTKKNFRFLKPQILLETLPGGGKQKKKNLFFLTKTAKNDKIVFTTKIPSQIVQDETPYTIYVSPTIYGKTGKTVKLFFLFFFFFFLKIFLGLKSADRNETNFVYFFLRHRVPYPPIPYHTVSVSRVHCPLPYFFPPAPLLIRHYSRRPVLSCQDTRFFSF